MYTTLHMRTALGWFWRRSFVVYPTYYRCYIQGPCVFWHPSYVTYVFSDTLQMSHMWFLTPYICAWYRAHVSSDTLHMSHMCFLTPFICHTCDFWHPTYVFDIGLMSLLTPYICAWYRAHESSDTLHIVLQRIWHPTCCVATCRTPYISCCSGSDTLHIVLQHVWHPTYRVAAGLTPYISCCGAHYLSSDTLHMSHICFFWHPTYRVAADLTHYTSCCSMSDTLPIVLQRVWHPTYRVAAPTICLLTPYMCLICVSSDTLHIVLQQIWHPTYCIAACLTPYILSPHIFETLHIVCSH